MHRIGRDNTIINFVKDNIKVDDTIVLAYGEVDCRCHIQRQINMGGIEDEIITELVHNYFRTIYNNVNELDVKKVVVVGIIPQTKQSDYESLNGPITHEYPFVGTDEERVRYTSKMNKLLEEKSIENGYIYFNPYSYYTRLDGTLKFDFSDSTVHLRENSYFLEKFIELQL
jgi:hypothetical protein